MRKPTERFSDRVENYVKYRPGYPPELVGLLKERCGLGRESVVADVGSGTGILTKLFLGCGCVVHAVEPNREMREAAEQFLRDCPGFRSVDGTAEETRLPAASVDLVTAAQAFHWFDREKCRSEFRRILKPGGWMVLVWNERQVGASPFLEAYEDLLHTFAPEYRKVDHRNVDEEAIAEFFAPSPFEATAFDNHQDLDFDGLKGRLLSSSYAPAAGQPGHEPMLEALRDIFNEHAVDNAVRFLYETKVYCAQAPA